MSKKLIQKSILIFFMIMASICMSTGSNAMIQQFQEQHDEANQKLSMLRKRHQHFLVDFPGLRGDRTPCRDCVGRTWDDCAREYDLLTGKVTRLAKQIKEMEKEENTKKYTEIANRAAQEKKEKEEARLRAIQLEEAELRLQLLKEQLSQAKEKK